MAYAEIVAGSQGGDALSSLCAREDVRTIVEIGTLDGTGSTRLILNALRQRSDQENLKFVTIKANADAYRLAQQNNPSVPPYVRFLHGNLLDQDSPLLVCNLNEQEQSWLTNDLQFRFPVRNVLSELPDSIDVLVLDGGEFTTFNDYIQLGYKSRILYLDDVNIRKNRLVKEVALRCGFKLIFQSPERNGAAILEKE